MSEFLAGPRRWWIFGGLAAVVLLAAGWLLVVGPQRAAAGQALEETERVDQQSSIASAQVKRLQEQYSELDQARKELEALEARIPNEEQVSAVLRKANDSAKASGVALTSFAPSPVSALGSSAPEKGTGRLGFIAVQIAGSGKYDSIRAYLEKLENLDRAFMVTSLTLTKSDGGGSGGAKTPAGDITFTITARVFVKGDAVPAPTPKATAAPKD